MCYLGKLCFNTPLTCEVPFLVWLHGVMFHEAKVRFMIKVVLWHIVSILYGVARLFISTTFFLLLRPKLSHNRDLADLFRLWKLHDVNDQVHFQMLFHLLETSNVDHIIMWTCMHLPTALINLQFVLTTLLQYNQN